MSVMSILYKFRGSYSSMGSWPWSCSHSLQKPSQLRLTHWPLSGAVVAGSSFSHSLQIPSQLRRRHLPLSGGGVLVGTAVVEVDVGVEVEVDVGEGVEVTGGVVMVMVGVLVASEVVSVASLQPQNLPGDSQLVVVVLVAVVSVVVVLSLHPNQPGVLQVDVVVVVVGGGVAGSVVVSSRQPHQPGVLQVDVRVLVRVDVDVAGVVVVSVPLLSYIFHWAQSRHSGVFSHLGTSSYLSKTSLMTLRILCVPMPTRQPLSATTS